MLAGDAFLVPLRRVLEAETHGRRSGLLDFVIGFQTAMDTEVRSSNF